MPRGEGGWPRHFSSGKEIDVAERDAERDMADREREAASARLFLKRRPRRSSGARPDVLIDRCAAAILAAPHQQRVEHAVAERPSAATRRSEKAGEQLPPPASCRYSQITGES
jgi:hypothetical protein